jgi:hypothetical protein
VFLAKVRSDECPVETLREIVSEGRQDDNWDMYAAALINPACPDGIRVEALQSLMICSDETDEFADVLEVNSDWLEEVLPVIADAGILREVCQTFARTGTSFYSSYVAQNPHCPDDVWVELLECDEWTGDEPPYWAVWHDLLSNPRRPPAGAEPRLDERISELLREWDLGQHHSWEMRRLVAAYAWTSAATLLHMAAENQDPLADIREEYDLRWLFLHQELYRNPSFPEVLAIEPEALTTDPAPYRALYARGLEGSNSWALEIMFEDGSDVVRAAVGGNPATPDLVLRKLATDSSENVRTSVWANPRASDETRALALLTGVRNDPVWDGSLRWTGERFWKAQE